MLREVFSVDVCRPMIHPPENEWCSRVLPYWDTVGTMMPHRFEGGDAFLRP